MIMKTFKKPIINFFCLLFLNCFISSAQERKAPAYPLITHDPYFSIWSFSDTLSASPTKHWTGSYNSITGLIKVDNKIYRFLGEDEKRFLTVLPASDEKNYSVSYIETEPPKDWNKNEFNDENWKTGIAPIGDNLTQYKTIWQSKDIWTRRTFTIDKIESNNLFLKIRHDDKLEVYLNGDFLSEYKGRTKKFVYYPINNMIKGKLRKGENILAIHCTNTGGRSCLDAGIVKEVIQNRIGNIITVKQDLIDINATQTIYQFTCGKINLTLTFTSPLLLNDLDLLSRPVSYISYKVKSNDHVSHNVEVYLGVSSNIAVNSLSQEVVTENYTTDNLNILKAGTKDQPILQKKGDDLRIDWGFLYVAVPKQANAKQYITDGEQAIKSFIKGKVPTVTEGKQLVLNSIIPFGPVNETAKEKIILLAYDDLYSIQFFYQNLKPWWKRNGTRTIEMEIEQANTECQTILQKCDSFNKKMYNEALLAGGENYAKLCVLAYRQSIAAHKLVESPQGEILFLSKENFSNGSINTVDVTYPSAPLYLVYNPDLLKGMLNGIFFYSESAKWNKPFPAHDLGTYPLANGQTYGEDMPVEEAGNMLILTTAIAAVEGNATYADKHWETLTGWAEYLLKNGLDPENQLCTDDFAGHLAHNTNLSVKAIVAIAGFGKLAGMLGKNEVASKYSEAAKEMADKWILMADAGDHFGLTFNKKDTWSQKYNMVWDKILGLGLFSPSVLQKEISYYLTKQNSFGLPLDNRASYSKSDWIVWSATLSNDTKTFTKFIDPLYKYALETPSRVPMSDWFETTNGKMVGFQARSVVGGYYIKILENKLSKK